MEFVQQTSQFRYRDGGSSGPGTVVIIAVSLILFATIGFTALQLLATAGTTSFQPTVVIVAVTVVSIVAALAVALTFLRFAGIRI